MSKIRRKMAFYLGHLGGAEQIAVRRLAEEVSPEPPGESHDWRFQEVLGIQAALEELPRQVPMRDEFLVIYPSGSSLSGAELDQVRERVKNVILGLKPGWNGKLTVKVLK